ncbi:MAG TPA: glycosyltransferase [Bryobacteraceae bacterium]|jgi:glycosyltransferase involved in cell wall biosynthesis|nr:glycosyltransferase [Bryobacteraceae bacterium]
MNFLYLDPGLLSNIGHSAFSCRHITGEMKRRGINTYVLAHKDIQADVRKELNAESFFTCYTWSTYSPLPGGIVDPFCGWLNDFEIGWSNMRGDLEKIRGVTAEDVVYVNSVRAPQVMAVWSWFTQTPLNRRPRVFLEFGNSLNVSLSGKGVTWIPDPMNDSMPTLLRYIGLKMRKEDQARFKLATFATKSSNAYSKLMEYPVVTLPLPHRAITDCHSRVGKRIKTVAVIGQQGWNKGYQHVPQFATQLLAQRNDVRLLIHNNIPNNMARDHGLIRALAAADTRITVNEQFADAELWSYLLNESDLLVCPYHAKTYSTSYSAVASEAMANAIPLIAPADSTLSDVLEEFNTPGATFSEFTSQSVLEAILKVLDDFDNAAERATLAARQWEATKGAGNLVDVFLGGQGPRRESPENPNLEVALEGVSQLTH